MTLRRALTILVSAIGMLLLLACPLAWQAVGSSGVIAALLAAGICLVGSAVALVVTAQCHGPQGSLIGMLLSMPCRLLPPMTAVIVVALNASPAHRWPALLMIGLFYTAALVLDTWLSVRMIDHGATMREAS